MTKCLKKFSSNENLRQNVKISTPDKASFAPKNAKPAAPLRGNKNKIRIAFILIGVLFVLLGAWRGEMATVLQKAVYICLECIGIG